MLREMKVAGVSLDPLTEMPIILLKDAAGTRCLPIWIGTLEAAAIAAEIEEIKLSSPTTHDLLKSILFELGASVVRVEIMDLKEGTYRSNLVLKQGSKTTSIDARPSDAIAIALRAGCPILVEEHVVEQAREIDLRWQPKQMMQSDPSKLKEMLANLPDQHFGKWKM
jgi:uncharacterized protein